MRKNDLIRLTVTDVNNLGCGVGHLESAGRENGMTVFVRGAVTGEEIEARVIKVNSGYLVARLEKILKPSPCREEKALCNAPLGCGGCAFRHVTYAHETELKRGYVQNAFRKAGLPDVAVEPVRTAGSPIGYRNKAQYPVQAGKDGKPEAGFYANASHRIVPVTDCGLQPRVFGEIVTFLCGFCGRHRVTCYDETTGKGLLRHFYLREGKKTGEVMVCLVLNGKAMAGEETLWQELHGAFPCVTSLFFNENTENTNVVLGDRYRLLGGNPWIEDELCGLRFRIAPQAFYQVNHDACEMLYGLAGERAGLTGNELLLDLYCGIGTIGLSMAGKAGEVLGMEIVEEAVACAKENAERNGISNASFYCGDASDPQGLLKKAKETHKDLSGAVVVLDPPRKGTTPELIAGIAGEQIRRVVYISCNPDTLARDCAIFRTYGYGIGTATPVDLFPRTGHVETVVLLTKIG